MEELLKEYAEKIGILVGWKKPVIDREVADLMERRMEDGKYPPFVRWSVKQRIDPNELLSDTKTIICIAVPYSFSYFPKPKDKPRGKLSRFSWGKDYHHVVNVLLECLANFINKYRPINNYALNVDTGPLVDKYWAQQSGIGWYGKNTTVITEKYGSWVALGELLLDVDLQLSQCQPDISSMCENCEKCIRACPTGAIEAPYVVNPYKCLSFLTQKTSEFSLQYREKLGDRLYGCDICQEACPHNHRVAFSKIRDFSIDDKHVGLAYPDLEQLLNVSNKQFKQMFGNSTCGWRGKNIIKRNALIASGNLGYSSQTVYQLAEAESDVLRRHAYWSLSKTEGLEARDFLLRRYKVETLQENKEELDWCLEHLQ